MRIQDVTPGMTVRHIMKGWTGVINSRADSSRVWVVWDRTTLVRCPLAPSGTVRVWASDLEPWDQQEIAEASLDDVEKQSEADKQARQLATALRKASVYPALVGALQPFADFLDAAERMGGTFPQEGALYTVHSYEVGKREITKEHLVAARQALATAQRVVFG